MEKKKIILPKLRYERAPEIDVQFPIGLEEEKSSLRNDDRDIVLDLSDQFAKEREECQRYKLYGKMKMVFRNLYAGQSNYDYLKERLYLVSDGSDGNFCGYLPYNEFAFLRNDLYHEIPEPQSVSELSGFTEFNIITVGTTEHQEITTISSPKFNWNLYLTYVFSHDSNYPIKYTLTGNTELSFVSGDGIPFRVQETASRYILTSPVPHGINQGEYILINGNYYYVNSVGNQYYRSEKYVVNILKSQLSGTTFNVLINGKRCTDINDTDNSTSQYYVHKHKTLTTENDYILDKLGFESPIWEDEKKLLYENSAGENDVLVVRNRMESIFFTFKEPYILSGITNNLGYTPIELYLTTAFRNGNGYFNYPPKVGYSFHLHDTWIDNHFDGDSSLETGMTYSTFLRESYEFYKGNEIPIGTELYGAFVEYNPKEMKERIISESFHKITINSSIFNHGQTLSSVYNGASETNPFGLLYQTHYRFKLRELSPYVENSDPDTIIGNLPENARYFSNEKTWRWRDLYEHGYIDPDGYGVNYPYMNDMHYIFQDIGFYIKNERLFNNKKDQVVSFYNVGDQNICYEDIIVPSVTPSPTPSVSVTPGLSPSISVTPTITPSITISTTPSITPSVSSGIPPTPSQSQFGYIVSTHLCAFPSCEGHIGDVMIVADQQLTIGKYYKLIGDENTIIEIIEEEYTLSGEVVYINGISGYDTCNDACAAPS